MLFAERRLWLLASLIAGISFYFAKDLHLAMPLQMAWKGAGVALLALYALARSTNASGRQIALVMACGALGDVLLELSLMAGAVAFLAGHLVALHLYWRHPRSSAGQGRKLAGLAVVILIPTISYLLPTDRAAAPGIAFYALGLGAMAVAAWYSSYARNRVGLGAAMFVASDLLIFARIGPLATSALPELLIWPLYYFGQFLICTGVLQGTRRKAA